MLRFARPFVPDSKRERGGGGKVLALACKSKVARHDHLLADLLPVRYFPRGGRRAPKNVTGRFRRRLSKVSYIGDVMNRDERSELRAERSDERDERPKFPSPSTFLFFSHRRRIRRMITGGWLRWPRFFFAIWDEFMRRREREREREKFVRQLECRASPFSQAGQTRY